MSELETIACGGCGAPLQIPTAASYVTCRFCSSQLHVQRTETVVFTEVVKSLQEQADRLENATERLNLQQQLLQIDSDWDRTRDRLMIHNKEGRRQPSRMGAAVGIVVIGIISLVCLAVSAESNPMFGFFGLVVAVVGGFGVANEFRKASEWESAERRHRSERSRVQRELANLDGSRHWPT